MFDLKPCLAVPDFLMTVLKDYSDLYSEDYMRYQGSNKFTMWKTITLQAVLTQQPLQVKKLISECKWELKNELLEHIIIVKQ